jgi:Iron-containing redox enzyme
MDERDESGARRSEPSLPMARGPITGELFDYLTGAARPALLTAPESGAIWDDDDAQLALYCCYELHYRGFAGISADLEWDPVVLDLRSRLEHRFLGEVTAEVAWSMPSTDLRKSANVEAALLDMATAVGGRSLSGHLASVGTIEQLREFCMHRSAYQLKEADPHTWAIPRLAGPAKAAMVEIQADEYGNGRVADMHAELFADTMSLIGLDPTYGTYLDLLPGVTLATTNLISLLGLHRRWRGALVGHLALFEMTSVGPMSRYVSALARFGLPEAAQRFYATHVEIDEHHQQVALESMVRALVTSEPALGRDVVFGAAALTAVEARFANHLLDSWSAGQSSLGSGVGQVLAG